MAEIVNFLQTWFAGLLYAGLPVVAIYLLALLKSWVNVKVAELKANAPQLAGAISTAVNMAVKAAEQMGLSDKKQYALSVAQEWLDLNGWGEIDVFILEAAIESAVLEKFNSEDSAVGRPWSEL